MDVIGPVVKPGLTFCLIKLFQKVRRLQSAYRSAFDNSPVEARIVELAIKDIRAVFGRAGFLNDPLDQFLDEIGRTGLLDQLCMAAITGENIERARLLFSVQANNHYSRKSAKRPNLNTLFEQFIRIIHTSAEKSSIDVESLQKDLSAKRQLQAAGILRGNGDFHALGVGSGKGTELTQLYKNSPWLSTTSIDCSKFIRKISGAVLTHFSDITVEGPSNRQLRLQYDRIYVEPNLTSPADRRLDRGPIYNSYAGDQLALAVLLQELSQIVILGDPGGGKTTVARIHCHRIGTVSKETGDILPIFITVRHFEAAINVRPQLSLLKFIANEVGRQSNAEVSELSNTLQYALLFGRCFIVFDGLDEIIDIARRRDFVGTVLQFMESYPLNRYVVTSRKVGYDEAPLRDPPTFVLSSFGVREIRQYANLSALNVFNVRPDIVTLEVDRFIQESKKNAEEFLGSPLLLSLIIWLFFSTQRIPDGRLNIYKECAELMFQRWDALRGIYPDVPAPFRLFSLLVDLSSSFYLDAALQAGASRAWLRTAVKEFFEKDLSENAAARALEAATKFTDHLIGRAWVLHEVGADRFEFTHRTFLEYFFAKHLSERHETIDQLFNEISSHILKSEWVLPAHLALQLKIDGSPFRAARASERLRVLGMGRKKMGAPTASARGNGIIAFIAEATRYLQPNERRLEEIAELVTLRGIGTRHGVSLVFNVLRNPNEMRDAVYRGIASGMGKLYEERQFDRFGIVVDWIKANRYVNAFYAHEAKYLPGAIGESTNYIVDIVIKHMVGAREGSPAQQKMMFDLMGEYSKAFVKEPGLQVWAQSCAPPFSRVDWRFIDSICALKEIRDEIESGTPAERSFISLGASIFKSLFGSSLVSVAGQPTVFDKVESELLSFISVTTFGNQKHRSAALASLLIMRESIVAHSDREGFEKLNFDIARTIKSFVRHNGKLMDAQTNRNVENCTEGRGRIFREEFQEVPKSPQDFLNWNGYGA